MHIPTACHETRSQAVLSILQWILVLQQHLKVVNCFEEVKQMTTQERAEIQVENEWDLLANGAQELARLQARIGPHFRRAEVRERGGRFLRGLLSGVERKNGWRLAAGLDE